MPLIDKKNQTIAVVVLIATAYFTMFYDIVKHLLKNIHYSNPYFDPTAGNDAIAGFLGIAAGLLVLWMFGRDKKKKFRWRCKTCNGDKQQELSDQELESLRAIIREQSLRLVNDPRIKDKHQALIEVETMLHHFIRDTKEEISDEE